MISGTVNARREATLSLVLTGPGGTTTIAAVIDTGFSGNLVVPDSLVQQLQLVRKSAGQAILADGTTRFFDIYDADLEWDGQTRTVKVSAIGTESLVGMSLLDGYRLVVDVTPGGAVEVTVL